MFVTIWQPCQSGKKRCDFSKFAVHNIGDRLRKSERESGEKDRTMSERAARAEKRAEEAEKRATEVKEDGDRQLEREKVRPREEGERVARN